MPPPMRALKALSNAVVTRKRKPLDRPVRFGMMMFEDHPYGRVCLDVLKQRGYEPTVTIEERSEVSAVRCGWYTKQLNMAGETPPLVHDICGSTERVFVDKQGDQRSIDALKAHDLDVLLLGGAGIIPEEVFGVPRHGTLNVHPGLLPYIRGSLPVAWSLQLDIPVGVTLHHVTAELDCGAWVSQQRLPITRADTFEGIVSRSCEAAGDLFVGAVEEIQAFDELTTEDPLPLSSFGPNKKWSKSIEAKARSVLELGTYGCYEDPKPEREGVTVLGGAFAGAMMGEF